MNVDGPLFKRALLGSLAWLSVNQEEVNRLNVFPVPDGDTGTNMLLTLESAVEDVKESPAVEVSKIAALAAHGSLMGARGNSGVILSQIFRGFARHAQGKAEITPVELAGAFEEAANAAYRAANPPTEGTILTVAREAARAAAVAAQAQGATAVTVMKATAKAARIAVEKTPTQLPILREAGVVDAGGFGLQIMLEGFLRSFEETDLQVVRPAAAARKGAQVAMELPEEGWGFCTQFIIEGAGLAIDAIRQHMIGSGNSALVVGDSDLIRVHVHTDDPTDVLRYASGLGTVGKVTVDDMSVQHKLILENSEDGAAEVPPHAPPRANGVGLVSVVAGPGLVEIFRALGVDAVVEGGQTMNPSTQDMLLAVDSLPYDDVVLLPNNGNVIAAAAQVAKLTSKRVHLLETRSVPQGVEAVVAFNPEEPLAENLEAMRGAAGGVQTIEVTHAVRDTTSDGIKVREGDVIVLINDKLAFAGRDYAEVVGQAIGTLDTSTLELITVYRGDGVTEADAEGLAGSIRSLFPNLELEVQPGGQPHYPFILAVQ